MPMHRLTRRQLLGTAGASLALAALPTRSLATGGAAAWQNWSGNQRANPAAVLYPANEAELVQLVKTAQGPIRPFGGSHSFSPLVPSTGTLVSLEQMTGLAGFDAANHQATFTGGTRIAIASEMLAGIGQNFENEPDINLQSLAGAISTGTHGTGQSLKCLAGYVAKLKLVLADGSVVTCSRAENRELFDAARTGMGTCGIITEITLQNRAAYKLAETTTVMSIREACDFMTQRRGIDRHIEFFAFPFGDKAIVKQMALSTAPDTPAEEPAFDENELVRLAAEASRLAPFSTGLIQRLIGAFVTEGTRVAPAHRMFPAARTVQFNEMEYTVPLEQGVACLMEVVEVIRQRDINVFFPIEFRCTAADDTCLSMFAGRAGASISVHQYHRQDHRELFDAVEPVMRRYGGRPHWGKLHNLAAKDLRAVYPRWDEFLATRQRVDPQGRFLTPYMRNLLGVPA